MANPVTIKLSGFDELAAKLDAYAHMAASEVLKPVLAAAGEIVAKQMADNAPKDSGLLASDFNVKIQIKDNEEGKAFIGPGFPEEYPLKREEKK